jgi:hypothetical protein
MDRTRSTSTNRQGARRHKAQEAEYVRMSTERHQDIRARQRRMIRQWASRRDISTFRIHEER